MYSLLWDIKWNEKNKMKKKKRESINRIERDTGKNE